MDYVKGKVGEGSYATVKRRDLRGSLYASFYIESEAVTLTVFVVSLANASSGPLH